MTRKRLLVVGGEPQVNDWLARAFATEFEILTAQTGVEAINKAVLQRPTCILVDAKMPRMGEHLLSKVFKMIEQTRSIPIVMVCENPDPEFRKMFQEMGVVACIEKPLSLEQVASVIDRALRTPLNGGLLFYVCSAFYLWRPPAAVYRALLYVPRFIVWKLWVYFVLSKSEKYTREWIRTSRSISAK